MTVKLICACAVSLIVSLGAGLVIIPAMRRLNAGQSIREDGPTWHNKKQGTPMMGGLIFIIGIGVSCVINGWSEMVKGEFSHIYILLFGLIYAGIGFLDDYEKARKKRNLGLTAIQKLILQLVVAVVFVLLMRLTGNLTTSLYVPFVNITISVPEWVYFVFAAFVIVATVNAVNITDGADGLASGVSIPVAASYTLIAAMWGYTSLGIFAAALTGGLMGFLFFNFHPAKIFMGDTGSLFLGGVVCALAFSMDMPLILIPLGIVYIMETLSDIIQVVYFKATHGKRIFKMAPLHHHFEMSGWSEYKLFAVFTGVSALFAVLSYVGVSGRFNIS